MTFSQKHKHIHNCEDFVFKKMKIGIRNYKEAKKENLLKINAVLNLKQIFKGIKIIV